MVHLKEVIFMRKRNSFKKVVSRFLVAVMAVNLMATSGIGMIESKAAGTAKNAVNIAASQVGYHEKASYSNLDDFTANSGSGNYNKYARDIGIANGQPWCATFVWWCMRSAEVSTDAYPQSAYVPTIKNWFNARGLYRVRGTYIPKSGDYIMFGDASHVGIVESVSGNYVNTIEGNSSDSVIRRTYSLDSSYILGYGIVNYVIDDVAPVLSDIVISDISETGYTITCKVEDEYGIDYVAFPTWTIANDQDDLDKNWFVPTGKSFGQINGNIATFRVNASDHNNELGQYTTHIYVYDKSGNVTLYTDILLELKEDEEIESAIEEATDEDLINELVEAVTEEETIEEVTTEEVIEEVVEEVTEEATTEEVIEEEVTEEVVTEEEVIEEVTTEEVTEEVACEEDAENVSIEVSLDNSTTNVDASENTYTTNNTYNQEVVYNYEGSNTETVIYVDNEDVKETTENEMMKLLCDIIEKVAKMNLSNYVPEDFSVDELLDVEMTNPECDEVEDVNKIPEEDNSVTITTTINGKEYDITLKLQ